MRFWPVFDSSIVSHHPVRLSLSLLIGLLVSAGALYLAFRHVPFEQIWAYLGQINYWWMLPSSLLVMMAFGVRVWRWQIILAPARRVGYWRAFHPLMIGFMLNCIMPGRVGELARPLLLRQSEGTPFSTGLATVVVERVFDFAFLVCALGIILSTVDIDPELRLSFASYELNRATLISLGRNLLLAALLALAGTGLLGWSAARQKLKIIMEGLPRHLLGSFPAFQAKIETAVIQPLTIFIDNFARGLELIKSLRRIGWCLILSLVIWALSVLSYYTMMLGAPNVDLKLLELAVVMIIVSFFIALPSVPGFWGIWEAGGMFALLLFGISGQEAAGYTLVNHVVQIFSVIAVGFVSALVTGVNVLQMARHREP